MRAKQEMECAFAPVLLSVASDYIAGGVGDFIKYRKCADF